MTRLFLEFSDALEGLRRREVDPMAYRRIENLFLRAAVDSNRGVTDRLPKRLFEHDRVQHVDEGLSALWQRSADVLAKLSTP